MTETEDLIDSENRALIWPAILAVSLFLPWAKVSGLLSIQVTGFDMDIGPVILIVTLVVAASWVYENGEYRQKGWLGGGIILGLLSVVTILNIQSGISQYQSETEGNMFADAVAVNIGIGAYIAVIASAAIIYIGYQMYTPDTAEYESEADDTPENSHNKVVEEETD
jgi:hypothetical protein